MVAKRNARSFEECLKMVDIHYDRLKVNVNEFRKKLNWDVIAKQHLDIYENVLRAQKDANTVDFTTTATRLELQ